MGTRVVVPYEAPQGRRVNVIGARTRAGAAPRFVYHSRRSGQGRLDSAAFLDFVCREVAQLPASWDALPPGYVRARPCTVVLDNYGVHHSKPVKAWLEENKEMIEVFYLPSYSPELNPEERLNADLKHVIGAKVPARTKIKLKAAVSDHMIMLENNPERVKSYFQDPRVKYAA